MNSFLVSRSALRIIPLLACWLLCGGNSCSKKEDLTPAEALPKGPSFSGAFAAGAVKVPGLQEVSGIAGGINDPGLVWAHNDSGDDARIFALTDKGVHMATYYLEGAEAVDWEDMASGTGPVPGKKYLYIADIGDNLAKRSCVVIYRFEEPLTEKRGKPYTDTIEEQAIDTFFLKYEGGPRDAETFMTDPISGKAFIVSKREAKAGLYQVRLPASPTDTLMLQRTGTLPYTGMTGGDISPDGREILLKNYNRLFYWQRSGNTQLEKALGGKARRLLYAPEPQGEAIAWKKDGSGFFTLSEEVFGISAMLYWHKRK
ncbi:hypothetical protein EDD80_101494 [Anseongella ginsenosidimutans]|uniref:WD40 repeat protein n=1 Tax=Anseongella ginsenosidimutans TaxID=496056 RepID=A0A4R3KYC2_9SPHI|nr:hypothetical protein [Anseongella ginsenosidimutans]QEC51050.1 hypothetical protein FRZ59_00910 [Anseongella ginsenosidimutans]TCS90294.1 hypothetical protein EDD80_101494 [Anseongella ginsenosidimutans]